jgi:hypothetical protein
MVALTMLDNFQHKGSVVVFGGDIRIRCILRNRPGGYWFAVHKGIHMEFEPCLHSGVNQE